MLNKSELNIVINKLHDKTKNYVNTIGYGYKTKNNIKTNEKSIIFGVSRKKNIDQIPSDELLPAFVEVGDEIVKTDVISIGDIRALSSYRSNCFKAGDSSSSVNRSKRRPLLGGCSIIRTGFSNPNAGTLGLIVRDKEDGTIVGLTNNHVIARNAFFTSELNSSLTLIDNTTFGVLQPGTADGGVDPSDRIGFSKRYEPMSRITTSGSINFIDAAICSLNNLDFNSIKILGLDNPSALPFATSSEINNLLDNNNKLFKSGRTTGAVGFPNCPMIIFQENLKIRVGGYIDQNSNNQVVEFSDCLAVVYEETQTITDPYDGRSFNFPRENVGVGGDSGSVVVADIAGINKVVGLFFAGGTLGVDRPPKPFTVTISSPATFTCFNHGLSIGDMVFLNTTGFLPTGLNTISTYYVISSGFSTNNFRLSLSPGGSAINTSGTQSGSHTLESRFEPLKNSFGIFCRIDRVANLLNIEPWNTVINPIVYDSRSNWEFIQKSGKSDKKIIFENGKKYWQVGSSGSSGSINTVYAHFPDQTISSPTTPPPVSTTSPPPPPPPPPPPLPPGPSPGKICDTGIECSFVFDKTSDSFSLYIVYKENYSYTDSYLELQFYNSSNDIIQNFTTFATITSKFSILKLENGDPRISVDVNNICSIEARIYQPSPCEPSEDDFDSDSSDIFSPCDDLAGVGDMTGYLVEAIYVHITDNSECVPEQQDDSDSIASNIVQNIDSIKEIEYLNSEISVLSNPGDISGCGIEVKSPCGGGHVCNRAQFDIFLSANDNPDVLVLEANLNNGGPSDFLGNTNPDPGPSKLFGGSWDPLPDGIGTNILDRYSSSIITKEQNDAIFAGIAGPPDRGDPAYSTIVKIIESESNTNPHKDITWVRIKDTCGRIVYSCCIGVGVLNPDPCCEAGGGPLFPSCSQSVLDELGLEKGANGCPTMGSGDSGIILSINPSISSDKLFEQLEENNVIYVKNKNVVEFLDDIHNKNLIIKTLKDINLKTINYFSVYKFDINSGEWNSSIKVPDRFIFKCTDKKILFEIYSEKI
jgi:hypothetical protein